MVENLIGREAEKRILQDALISTEAELIAVYGRRRVGKTFLIRSVYGNKIVFEISGIHQAKFREQLANFSLCLQKASGSSILLAVPTNWIQAFAMLQRFLETKKHQRQFNEKLNAAKNELPLKNYGTAHPC